jgi:ferredoxin--NADP+ reductase
MSNDFALGAAERPLRAAIVGSGPSGFYAAAALFKQKDLLVEVDMFERLPTPYGLVRGGVAPDHQNIKAVTRAFERTARSEGFRFFGNVKIGEQVSVEDLYAHYDQVVYAVGTESHREMGIPGEDLGGSFNATEFVGWYNGHPDFQDRDFDLENVTTAVVVGIGNVAVDCARILVRDPGELATTDITDEALAALRKSAVREVYMLGRRGPAQAKFAPAEIKEIADCSGADLVLRPEDAALDPVSIGWLESLEKREQKNIQKNLDFLADCAASGEGAEARKVRLWLLTSPIELIGKDGRVAGAKLERNSLSIKKPGGEPRPSGTGEVEEIQCQLALRAIGYHGIPLPGVPFDDWYGIIPNEGGRVVDPKKDRAVVPGAYVVGWAKRGPSGLVGTNRACSFATVDLMLEDARGQTGPRDGAHTSEGALAMVKTRQPDFITFEDWQKLDAMELAAGEERGKVRHKFTSTAAALEALRS